MSAMSGYTATGWSNVTASLNVYYWIHEFYYYSDNVRIGVHISLKQLEKIQNAEKATKTMITIARVFTTRQIFIQPAIIIRFFTRRILFSKSGYLSKKARNRRKSK